VRRSEGRRRERQKEREVDVPSQFVPDLYLYRLLRTSVIADLHPHP